jgi:hypothetical protein
MLPEKQKVYRLSNIPSDADRYKVIQLLVQALGDISYDSIKIFSLAFSLDHLNESPLKTATLTFKKVPDIIGSETEKSQWRFELPGLSSALLLDSHFLGFTPLNDVSGPQHLCEYAALSNSIDERLNRRIIAVLLFLGCLATHLDHGSLTEATRVSCGFEIVYLGTCLVSAPSFTVTILHSWIALLFRQYIIFL